MKRFVPASSLRPHKMGAPARDFPFLAHLLGGWFHQDYSYEGDSLEQIVGKYKETVSDHERKETVGDIEQFLAENDQSEQAVANAVEAVFHPEVIIEGWDGFTAREWLLRVSELLS